MDNDTLYVITLEPIEQRYTKQWYEFWKDEFSKYFSKVVYIDGDPVSDKIENGRFLDINQTNIWKAEQVKKLAVLFGKNKINNQDKFIFMDAWSFGVTALKYMLQLNKIRSKMYGYFHAGSYDPHDFLNQYGLKPWAQHIETGWIKALDGVFVATKFHKTLILENLNLIGEPKIVNKIKVVGFPMDWEAEIKGRIGPIQENLGLREDLIVFPHRLDDEKNPEKFDKLKKDFPEYKFIKTLEVTKDKKDYYKLMSKAKICFSASDQETFGIGTVEALVMNVIPLVPDRLSYMELYDKKFIYTSMLEARQKLKYFMEHYDSRNLQKAVTQNKNRIIRQSLMSIKKMAEVMLK